MENIVIGILIGISFAVLLLSFFSWFSVSEGHIASLSRFGKAIRNDDGRLKLWKPGVHRKLPWEKVHSLSVMEKVLELSDHLHPFHTMARDGTTLSLQASVRLIPDLEHAEALIYGIENPIGQIRDYLSCVLRSEIANFGNEYDPGDVFIQLRNQQAKLRAAFELAASDELCKNYGVKLLGLDLVDMTPPQELANAMNSVQTARADSESLIARAHAVREKRVYSAKMRLEVSQKESSAAELEMVTIGEHLQSLSSNGTLKNYVDRRVTEVFKQSKLSIVKQEQK